MRLLPSSLFALVVIASAGCDGWPLYNHLPDPFSPSATAPFVADVAENAGLAEGALQELGGLSGPGTITISGAADRCGWDPDAAWPVWPEHPRDLDGDGMNDANEPWYAGWYSGDVDLYSLAADGDLLVTGELHWENEPSGAQNAEYRPGEPGPWEEESDLDLVVLSRAGTSADAILREVGFSRDYPETAGPPLLIADGDAIVLAVGCHHEVPSRYTLIVELIAP